MIALIQNFLRHLCVSRADAGGNNISSTMVPLDLISDRVQLDTLNVSCQAQMTQIIGEVVTGIPWKLCEQGQHADAVRFAGKRSSKVVPGAEGGERESKLSLQSFEKMQISLKTN